MTRILVLTLYSGENELPACMRSVAEQTGVEVVHETIRNLPNRLAHQELYRRFNSRRGEFDFMAKLDADMMFASNDSLASLLQLFEPGVDIVSATVWDGITDTDMQSFNIFRNTCVFDPEKNDPLFPDRVPTAYPGRHFSFVDPRRRVWHAFDPDPFQAFCFGVHRALKICQHGSSVPRVENAYHQWKFIAAALGNYSASGKSSAFNACLGAAAVVSGRISDGVLSRKEDYRPHFDRALLARDLESLKLLRRMHPVLVLLRIWGAKRFTRAVLSYVLRKWKVKPLVQAARSR